MNLLFVARNRLLLFLGKLNGKTLFKSLGSIPEGVLYIANNYWYTVLYIYTIEIQRTRNGKMYNVHFRVNNLQV